MPSNKEENKSYFAVSNFIVIFSCSHGYHGLRCERKYVDTATAGVMSRQSDKFPLCILGMAHYPCS